MGKKKKTYVKPEMKIIEVKTEGVIAASGGEIIDVPEQNWLDSYCTNSTFNGNAKNDFRSMGGDVNNDYTSNCQLNEYKKYASVINQPIIIDNKTYFSSGDRVTINRTMGSDNKTHIIITLGWDNSFFY